MQTLTKKPMKLPPRNAMVQLTDPDTGKARKMKALGQAARRIYRKQILAGTDPAFVLPRELRSPRVRTPPHLETSKLNYAAAAALLPFSSWPWIEPLDSRCRASCSASTRNSPTT